MTSEYANMLMKHIPMSALPYSAHSNYFELQLSGRCIQHLLGYGSTWTIAYGTPYAFVLISKTSFLMYNEAPFRGPRMTGVSVSTPQIGVYLGAGPAAFTTT